MPLSYFTVISPQQKNFQHSMDGRVGCRVPYLPPQHHHPVPYHVRHIRLNGYIVPAYLYRFCYTANPDPPRFADVCFR